MGMGENEAEGPSDDITGEEDGDRVQDSGANGNPGGREFP